jgi:hypothetical protein
MASAHKVETAPARTQERAALAEAIADRDAILARMAEIERLADEGTGTLAQHERALAAAERALADAVAESARCATGMEDAYTAPIPIRERRDAIQDARDTLAAHRAGRELLAREAEQLTQRLTYARMRVERCATAVVRADPATRRLLEQYAAASRRVADLDAAVYLIRRRDMVADADRPLLTLAVHDSRRAEAWRAAIELLAKDADAELPAG